MKKHLSDSGLNGFVKTSNQVEKRNSNTFFPLPPQPSETITNYWDNNAS
jgi:hypothetical protein